MPLLTELVALFQLLNYRHGAPTELWSLVSVLVFSGLSLTTSVDRSICSSPAPAGN